MQHVQSSGCAARILGRPVLGQIKAGIHPFIVINKKDDDRRGVFKNAQKTIGGIIREKEQCMEGEKRKQQVMDKLLKLVKTAKWCGFKRTSDDQRFSYRGFAQLPQLAESTVNS